MKLQTIDNHSWFYKALNIDALHGYMKDMFKYVHQVSTQTLRSSAENKLNLQKVHPTLAHEYGTL